MHRIFTDIYECIEKKTIVEYNKMQKCTGICICNAGRYVKLFIHLCTNIWSIMNLHKPDPHLLLYLLQTYEFPAYLMVFLKMGNSTVIELLKFHICKALSCGYRILWMVHHRGVFRNIQRCMKFWRSRSARFFLSQPYVSAGAPLKVLAPLFAPYL